MKRLAARDTTIGAASGGQQKSDDAMFNPTMVDPSLCVNFCSGGG
jgi:hypothetical protein